ncbi:hypothetical protein RvY_07083, partial [Ramazzottius varieornatus]
LYCAVTRSRTKNPRKHCDRCGTLNHKSVCRIIIKYAALRPCLIVRNSFGTEFADISGCMRPYLALRIHYKSD